MINWNLFREMDSLRREMDEIFRSVGAGDLVENAFMPGPGARRFPRLNLREDGDHYYLYALLPGVDTDHLDMNMVGNTLTLSGERMEEVSEQKRTWHRRERGAGKFLRTIELPAEVDARGVKAEFRNGVLEVVIPKAEEAKPKRIDIKVK